MARKRTVLYYVTAHGYGHGVRSRDIIGALGRQSPAISLGVVSGLPVSFFESHLSAPVHAYRAASFDVGMVQIDAMQFDLPVSLREIRAIYARRQELIEREISLLREHQVSVVVVDIPAIPLEAAAVAGIPGVAVGNFGWDWIYAEYVENDPRWEGIAQGFAEGYAKADLLLRLPFCEPMKAFRRIEDIPLVASPGRARRAEIADLTGCRPEHRWVLLAFTALDWKEEALDKIQALAGYQFFTVLPLSCRRRNIHPVDRTQVPFADLLASVDGVISKPGFGIVSECVVNRKPLLYADRTNFREHPVLVEAIRKYLKHQQLPADRLYGGDLADHLESLWNQPEPRLTMAAGGADVAARRIVQFLS